MSELIARNKKPSPKLLNTLAKFGAYLDDIYVMWDRLLAEGANEGFSEWELAEMVRPYLKQAGWTQGKIYYFFHRKTEQERAADNNKTSTDSTYIRTNDDKKGIGDSSESGKIAELEYKLEQRDEEIKTLKEHTPAPATPTLNTSAKIPLSKYMPLKNLLVIAGRDKIPFIRCEINGDEVTDFTTV